ncbi:Sugar phosphate isomerase/epimerase [Mucilaginibacter lappiensis]|uniref:Sugar phosphate isomerase/epimerase n=1 Tax=Mucilaginibacter lappiensis TaxID=354630 RepID=A0ABR6PUE2_9SPHI|nr:sugar phosphate isomerase/epimerase [Mucilaginibacter lappiensis]MBB6111916.1 sugar phosphate isomerase/epimerase [Mucilaginibacter lappiensis]SIR90393.1 Sugar phosphate isomerase/epimerase [Mucilaginibacter lappiensis]
MKKYTIILSACLALGSSVFAQSGKPLFTNAIGVQAYTFRSSMPKATVAVLDTIKALGITELEGEGSKDMPKEQFKKLCDERGIKIPSVGAGYDDIVKDPQAVVKLAKTLGASYVMVAWIPHKKEFTLEDAKKAVADFNRVGKILKENGLTFCYHSHGYEFGKYGDGTLFDYIAKNTDPRYVSFEIDILWSFHGGQDPAQLINKYPSRMKLMHLKDIRKGVANDLTGGTDTRNDVALGTGQINIPEVLKAAKKAGIKHYFIEDESPSYSKQLPVTIAYIKSLKN